MELNYEESILEEKPLKVFDIGKYKLKEEKKIDFEFQALGLEMKEYFKENFWHLFHHKDYSVHKIREAFGICKKRKIYKLNYLVGILRRL